MKAHTAQETKSGPSVRNIVPGARETAGEFAGHTPGPWTTKATASLGPQYAIYAKGDGNDIAIVYDHGPTQANAELIAAAPALLAERDALRAQLDTATDALRQRTEQRDAASRVVDAAEWLLGCFDDIRGVDHDKTRDALASLRASLAALHPAAK